MNCFTNYFQIVNDPIQMRAVYSPERKYLYPYYISSIEIGLLWTKIKYLRSDTKALDPNRYEEDLLNEVLNIGFGQEDAKISEVKVGGWKKYLCHF